MSSNKRIEWVDICKAYAIFLVVLGHVLTNEISHVYIYGFHMPLSFFLSGIVFDDSKYSFNSFIKSRINSIVIPYLFFYLITYLYWLVIESSYRSFTLKWWEPLIGMLYGSQYMGYMDHNGILWFLPCLFVVELLSFLIL